MHLQEYAHVKHITNTSKGQAIKEECAKSPNLNIQVKQKPESDVRVNLNKSLRLFWTVTENGNEILELLNSDNENELSLDLMLMKIHKCFIIKKSLTAHCTHPRIPKKTATTTTFHQLSSGVPSKLRGNAQWMWWNIFLTFPLTGLFPRTKSVCCGLV